MKLAHVSADMGVPAAQRFLGLAYLNGRAVKRDTAEAVRWLRKAAEQGYADAQTDLVLCFITGAYPEKTEMLYTNAAGNLKRTAQTGRKRVRASEYGILYELPKDEVLLFDSISPDPAVF